MASERELKPRIAVASRARHWRIWTALRDRGWPIHSRWPDTAREIEEGRLVPDWGVIWADCLTDVQGAHALILYGEPEDTLTGALVEAGAALGVGLRVFTAGVHEPTFTKHPSVVHCDNLTSALRGAYGEALGVAAHRALQRDGLGGWRAYEALEDEVQQILGKALGYPWYKDDPKNFPDATEEDGVCVGDHVAVTLAREAALRLNKLARNS